jgi:hypothetical protein
MVVFPHNMSVGFVRVECTSTICRSIGLMAVNPPGTARVGDGDVVSVRVPSSMFSHTSAYSGVWIYPRKQFVWLADHYTPFLRYEPGGVLGMRESMGAGGNGAFSATAYPVVDNPPRASLHPDTLVLHYGTRNWRFGSYWCELMLNHPLCLPVPEQLMAEAGALNSHVLSARGPRFPSHTTRPTAARDNGGAPEKDVYTAMATRVVEALSPLTISTCDVQKIRFIRSRFLRIANPSIYSGPEPHVPGLRVGYAPWITKGGSSSARNLLNSVLGVNSSDRGSVTSTLTLDMLHKMVFLSYVRNPVERALAGYHQMELFFQSGWLDNDIELYGLQWWKHHCPNTTLGRSNSIYSCGYTDTDRSSTEHALLRLLVYFNEVSSLGFYDQHITPMTYLLATNPVSGSSRSLLFDVSSMSKVAQVLTGFTNQQWDGTVVNHRTGLDKAKYPWMFTWKDLVRISHGDDSATATLASRAVLIICELYRDDIGCFPYTVSECNQ